MAIHKSKSKDIDCHEFDKSNSRNGETLSYSVGIIDCHANASAFARNDEKSAHNAKSVNNNQSSLRAREASVAIHKTKSKDIDSHANAGAFARNDETSHAFANAKDTHPQTPSAREGALGKPSKPKRLALSLITASALTGLALDISAAACQWAEDWAQGDANSHKVGRYNKITCTGSNSATFMSQQMGSTSYAWNGYYRETRWYLQGAITGDTVTASFSSERFPTGEIASQRQWEKAYFYQGVFFQGLSAINTKIQLTNKNSNVPLFEINSQNSNIKELEVHGNVSRNITINSSNIGTITTSAANTAYNMSIGSVSNIGSLSIGSNLNTLTIDGGSVIGAKLAGSGTIGTLNLGARNQVDSASIADTDFSSSTIGTLNILSYSLQLGNTTDTTITNGQGQIKVGGNTVVGVATAGITVTRKPGDTVTANKVYYFNDLISGGSNSFNLTTNEVKAGSGFNMNLVTSGGRQGFIIVADASTTYGASMYRSLAMSNMRRNAMTQNILNTMTTKTFHSDRYYNQEVELRLLQYDLSRLTNRSSKFSKTTRKNQSKVDKVREKMAKLTLEQSKGQNLDKGYNNFEVIDQLDAIFIPYTGRRDWRFFALPYASYTYGYLAQAETQEYAGGAIFGVQRNLRAAGIFGGYLGYEFANTKTQTAGADTGIQSNSIQAGLNYFKTFAITSKLWEGFIKANVRGGVDLPRVDFGSGSRLKLESDTKGVSLPLMWNIGAEVAGGITFYQFKRNSYVAPEISLSYDMLSTLAAKTLKEQVYVGSAMTPGNDEFYRAFYWHLPQLGASVRYYKMWGNTFRTNLKVGLKYNMLNKQDVTVTLKAHRDNIAGGSKYGGEENATNSITLPAVYGNLAFDFIWMVKKNHELSFGYDGLFYASTFSKDQYNVKTDDWFNGVTTTLNFKYAYWFGGSDYVTDKDGNAVSRSIAEGKKSKKGKKSKSKKSKKSKKKVYYIDG